MADRPKRPTNEKLGFRWFEQANAHMDYQTELLRRAVKLIKACRDDKLEPDRLFIILGRLSTKELITEIREAIGEDT